MTKGFPAEPYVPPKSELQQPTASNGKWFSFAGRMGVITLWANFAFLAAAFLVVMAIMAWASVAWGGQFEASGSDIAGAMGVALLLPITMLTSKRLHDLGLSAWFCLLLLLPFVGAIFGFYVFCMPGKGVSNRFGAFRAASRFEKNTCIVVLVLAVCLVAVALILATRFSS